MPQFISSPPESLAWHELATVLPYVLRITGPCTCTLSYRTFSTGHPLTLYRTHRTLYPGAGLPFYVLRSSRFGARSRFARFVER